MEGGEEIFSGVVQSLARPDFRYHFTFVTLSFLIELSFTCLYPTILTLVSLSYCRTLFFTLSFVYILYTKVIYRDSTML